MERGGGVAGSTHDGELVAGGWYIPSTVATVGAISLISTSSEFGGAAIKLLRTETLRFCGMTTRLAASLFGLRFKSTAECI